MPTSAPVYDDSTPWELVIPFAIVIFVTTGLQIRFLYKDYINHKYDQHVTKREKEKETARKEQALLEKKSREPRGVPTTTPANRTAATTRAPTPTRNTNTTDTTRVGTEVGTREGSETSLTDDHPERHRRRGYHDDGSRASPVRRDYTHDARR